MTSRDRFCFSRKGGTGGGGWVHPKGADSMAVSGLRFENALVGSEWTTEWTTAAIPYNYKNKKH